MRPAASVVIPSYNHSEFLQTCLDSLYAQTLQDWEAIVIDDCSTDMSLQILASQTDPRLKFSSNPSNLGTYATQTRGVEQAQAPYIAILNSDDLWEPTKLASQITLLDENRSLPLAYTLGSKIDTEGATSEDDDVHADWPRGVSQELLPYLLGENRVLASSVMFRREWAKFVPELRYSGDWVSLLQPAQKAPIGCIPERLTYWRMHSSNSFTRSPAQVDEEIWVRESILSVPSYWQATRLPRMDVRKGLARCAMHLAALYVLQGRILDGRAAARAALRMHPSKQAFRRLAAVTASADAARKTLWPSESKIAKGLSRPPILFDS